MQLTRTVIVIGGAIAIVACSSASSFSEVGGAFAGSSGAVGGVASGPTTGTSSGPPRCPTDAPSPGAPCPANNGVTCNYGPDVRDECADVYVQCVSGRWKDVGADCAVRCPKTFAEIAPGTTCGDIDMACSYDEGTCGCIGDRPAPSDAGVQDAGSDADAADGAPPKVLYPGVWKCVAPPTTVACPSARPRELDACVKRVTCDYGTCELGRPLAYDCLAGIWQESYDPPACDR